MDIDWSLPRNQWERLADSVAAPMQQRWIYGEVHQALGGQVLRACVTDGHTPVALCQFLKRRFFGCIPVALATHGPLCLSGQNPHRALTVLRRALGYHLRFLTLETPHPDWHNIPIKPPTRRAVLNLTTPAKMRAGLTQNWRNALRKAEKSGLSMTVEHCARSKLEDILSADAQAQSRKNYRALPAIFSQTWHSLSPDTVHLITARHRGRTVAHALFFTHGKTATYHIAHTTPQGRRCNASRLILWIAMLQFATQGMKTLDLGHIDDQKIPGLTRFKRGTGAEIIQGGGTVLMI